MLFLTIKTGGGGSGSPSGSNIYVVHTAAASSGACNSGVAFQSDGTIDMIAGTVASRTLLGNDDTTPSPVDHTGEWAGTIVSLTGSEWEIACTSITTGSWDTAAASTGAYVDLSTERVWLVNRTIGETTGTDSCNAVFRIREVADTSNYVDFSVHAIATRNP